MKTYSKLAATVPFLVLTSLHTVGPTQLPAQEETASARQWAILIGVEKYQRASPLRFTANDAVQIAHTLQARGGFDPDGILQITDDAPDLALRPEKANLLRLLPLWLEKAGPNDKVIVYFSGHGFRDSQGKAYLAPSDVDPADPAATGIPIEWLRSQIAACRATFKLLILNACHAGSEKGEESARSRRRGSGASVPQSGRGRHAGEFDGGREEPDLGREGTVPVQFLAQARAQGPRRPVARRPAEIHGADRPDHGRLLRSQSAASRCAGHRRRRRAPRGDRQGGTNTCRAICWAWCTYVTSTPILRRSAACCIDQGIISGKSSSFVSAMRGAIFPSCRREDRAGVIA